MNTRIRIATAGAAAVLTLGMWSSRATAQDRTPQMQPIQPVVPMQPKPPTIQPVHPMQLPPGHPMAGQPIAPMQLQPLGPSPTEQITTEKTIPNRPLLLTSSALVLGTYLPSMIVAAESPRYGDQYLFIPVAGPWIDLAVRGGCGPNPCATEMLYKSMLIISGIAQVGGAAGIVASFLSPETRVYRTAKTKPQVVPAQMGKNGYGVALVGAW